jgi:hypothetical protein
MPAYSRMHSISLPSFFFIFFSFLFFYTSQRTPGYLFHCHSQEEPHFLALVPSHFRLDVLLVFLRAQFTRRNHLLHHELRGTRSHVLLLLSHGRQDEAQVVQSRMDYRGTNFTNDCWCCRHCGGLAHFAGCQAQILFHVGGHQFGRMHHVRQLSSFVFEVLFWTLLCCGQKDQHEDERNDGSEQWQEH